MITNEEVLRSYIPIADYIQSLTCGRSEVLIHNLATPESSVFYIVGNLTNRKIGAPLTDYAINILAKRLYERSNFVSGYLGKSNDNKVIMRSSTMFIRNVGVEPIGLLCVNIDITSLVQAREHLEAFTSFPQSDATMETIFPSLEAGIEEIVARVELECGCQAGDFTKEQKLETVRKVAESGLFRVKGSVQCVAQRINVSDKTVYRYVSGIEVGKNGKQ
mgnify:CR=1 FL=1